MTGPATQVLACAGSGLFPARPKPFSWKIEITRQGQVHSKKERKRLCVSGPRREQMQSGWRGSTAVCGCEAACKGTGACRERVPGLHTPLIPDVRFMKSQTHDLSGNPHLIGGEEKNVNGTRSGLPRKSGHFLVSGDSTCCPSLGEHRLSNWTPDLVHVSHPRIWAL